MLAFQKLHVQVVADNKTFPTHLNVAIEKTFSFRVLFDVFMHKSWLSDCLEHGRKIKTKQKQYNWNKE